MLKETRNPIRALYNWVLSWAESRYGAWALFVLAFAESSFFPIPPDILLIALAVSLSKKSFKYALICSVGSITGGMFGYLLGWGFYESIGAPLIKFYQLGGLYKEVSACYQRNAFAAVATAGFTPIPYKVFTIAAGVCRIDFLTFVVASSLSRAARFFIIGALIYYFGPQIKSFIDKYFNLLTIIFIVLSILGFLLIKWL